MMPIEKVLSTFPDARKSSGGWSARCPAHDDRNPGLSISEGDDGRVLIHCHSGCATETVCQRKGLSLRDLMPDRSVVRHSSPAKGFATAEAAVRSPEAEDVLKRFDLDRIDTTAYSSGRGVGRLFLYEPWMTDAGVVKVEGLEVRIGTAAVVGGVHVR